MTLGKINIPEKVQFLVYNVLNGTMYQRQHSFFKIPSWDGFRRGDLLRWRAPSVRIMIVNPVSWLIFQQLSYATLHRFSRGYPVNRDGHNFPLRIIQIGPVYLRHVILISAPDWDRFCLYYFFFVGFGCCFYSLHHRSTCELSNGLPHRDTDTDRQFAFFAAFHRGVGRHHHRGVAVWSRRWRRLLRLTGLMNWIFLILSFRMSELFSESTFFNGFQK